MKILRVLGRAWWAPPFEVGLLFFLPLVFHRGFAEQFTYPKLYLTEILILTALAVWTLSLMWGRLSWPQPFRLGPPLALLVLAVLLSAVNSPVPAFSLQESMYFVCGPLWILFLVSWGGGETTMRRLAMLSALAGAVVAAIALLQWSGHDPLLYGGYQIDWGKMVARMRLYSTFGNPNFVAGYLIGSIFLALALGAISSRRGAKLCWWVCGGAMLAALVGTGSRGAWGGLVVGALVAGFVWRLWSSPTPITTVETADRNPLDPMARSFMSPALVWVVVEAVGKLSAALLVHFGGRVCLSRASWPLFAEHPLLGCGWGVFQLRFLELQARFIAANPACVMHWTNLRQLHNDPLQLLLETGALGLVAFGWVLWTYGQEMRELLRTMASRSNRWWLAASAGGITAMLVNSFFNFQLAVPPTFLLIFTLLAFPAIAAAGARQPAVAAVSDRRVSSVWPVSADAMASRRALGGASSADTERGYVSARGEHRYRVLRLLASGAVLLSAGVLPVERTRLAQAERDYQSGMLLENRGGWRLAERAYRQGVELSPLNGRLHFALARVLSQKGNYPEALAEALLAERTYSDSHTCVLKGYVLEQMGQTRPALETFRHAVAVDPTLKIVPLEIERLEKELSEGK